MSADFSAEQPSPPHRPGGLRLAHQLLGAYCQTQCNALIASLRDQIGAYLADPEQGTNRAVEMVLTVAGISAAVLRGAAVEIGRQDRRRWDVKVPPGHHRHDGQAYDAAEQVLNAVLNYQDARATAQDWLAGRGGDAALDLVCETVWLARIVHCNATGRSR